MARKAAKAAPAITAQKTAPAPRNGGARLPLGAHPGNTGGKKGRSGRKPVAFKVFASSEVSDPTVQATASAVLRDSTHPAYANVLKAMLAYGAGLPTQPVAHEGGITLTGSIKFGDTEIPF